MHQPSSSSLLYSLPTSPLPTINTAPAGCRRRIGGADDLSFFSGLVDVLVMGHDKHHYKYWSSGLCRSHHPSSFSLFVLHNKNQ
mmetsp:Transcript_13211/g.28664  ORF Transcript_13211/g.28664 Transcript_13211/m.28664 type:complete len:84 (+) Transcript_13211:2-253(+)